MQQTLNIILTGFMGAGKTTVGDALARRMGRQFIDMDLAISKRNKLSVADIFAQSGESFFREEESKLCKELSQVAGIIIATGGGTFINQENYDLLSANSIIIYLNASSESIIQRIQDSDRPLLDNWQKLLLDRKPTYQRIVNHVETDGLSIDEIVDRIYAIAAYAITTSLASIRTITHKATKIHIISNQEIWTLFGHKIEKILRPNKALSLTLIPHGEQYKTLATTKIIYNDLIDAQASRDTLVVALGGGVVLDVAGFAAATFMRGLDIVYIPTSLLAMVDASIGGKTGVNLPQGKNLVGAFKKPYSVIVDLSLLQSLPRLEYIAGFAEIVKHALIGDEELFALLESKQKLDVKEIVARSIRVKLSIIASDPCETANRIYLNLGHTFAHAIEAAKNYEIRHGEAVAIGLAMACELSFRLGLCEIELPTRVRNLLTKLELPTKIDGLFPEQIFAAMQHDKKRTDQKLRFIVPIRVGEVAAVSNIEKSIVLGAIAFTQGPNHNM